MIQLAVEEIPKIELKKLVQNFVTKKKNKKITNAMKKN